MGANTMTKLYFEEMMTELGFRTVDDLALGLAEGWPCSVQMEDGGFTLRILASGVPVAAAKTLKDKNLPHTRWTAYKKEAGEEELGSLVGRMNPPSDFYAKGCLHGALVQAPKALNAEGLHPPTACFLCGGQNCDRWVYADGVVRAVHQQCLDTRLNLPEKDSTIPAKVGGHYLTGILGAILGAGIAALPNWAQALSKGAIHPVLYVFIPVLAALVYRLFRGKARLLASGLTVLGASLGVSFVLELIWYWLVTVTASGANRPIAETTAMYFESHTIGLTLREMGFSLLFLMLGFFAAAVLLRRYVRAHSGKEQRVLGADTVRKTAFLLKEGAVQLASPPEEDLPAAPATPE